MAPTFEEIALPPEERAPAEPTIWGLSIAELHDRFWASRGVQVVRLGERSTIVDHAEMFLLTDPRTLVMLRINAVVDKLVWMKPDLLIARVRNVREAQYRETTVRDADGTFVRYRRSYGGWDSHLARVSFTRDAELARTWQSGIDVRSAWQQFRREIRPEDRAIITLPGRVYDRSAPAEAAQCVKDLVQLWQLPDTTIPGIKQIEPGVWFRVPPSGGFADGMTSGVPAKSFSPNSSPPTPSARAEGRQITRTTLGNQSSDSNAPDNPTGLRAQLPTEFIGRVWIGAGRQINPEHRAVLGPAVLWDAPDARPAREALEWQEIEPRDVLAHPPEVKRRSSVYERTKRAFDITAALFGLAVTLPLYPFICAATWLEDGRPFFFGHRRETRGGREFPCWKFRSMRKDADAIKARLQAENQSDGPQFFIARDPRLTRVGRFIRRTNIDELPQLWNVLIGDMSLIGPRPSPRAENQFCPPWREARLSVRPGITGLWQVMRTRRRGLDFQEWIKFDLEYVKHAGWRLDLWILMETARVLIRGQRTGEGDA